MRKIIPALAFAAVAAAALATPALAEMDSVNPNYANSYAPIAGGALVGTAVGVGLYNGWYGSSAFVTSAGATAGTAVAVGGVAGVGTVALLDAAVQPCRGFHAMFLMNRDECANGQWVGDAPRRRMMR